MKNKTKIRLIAGSLAATMALTLLTGCGSTKEPEYKNSSEYFSSLAEEDSKKEKEKYNEAGVVINGSNALVFLYGYDLLSSKFSGEYLQYGEDKFYGNINDIRYKDQDDLETKIKILAGDDCTITYQEALIKMDRK